MPTKLLNLIDSDFQHSNLFIHMPLFDAIHYLGHPDGKIQRYKALREDQECGLWALTIIRQEEDILWDAAEDLITRCVLDAAGRVQGVYAFDLLTFDIHHEANTFNYAEFGTLIANTARKLAPGEEKLVKYSSAYGLLKKLLVAHWGKITMKTSVEVYKDKPAFIFSLVKRLFKLAQFPNNPLILLIHDLSSAPLYEPGNKEQNGFIQKIIDEHKDSFMEFLPEVFWQDKTGMRELVSGSIIK